MIEEAELQLANMGDKIQEEVRKILGHIDINNFVLINSIRKKSKNKRMRKARKE